MSERRMAHNGFTLMEVMIAVIIGGVMILAATTGVTVMESQIIQDSQQISDTQAYRTLAWIMRQAQLSNGVTVDGDGLGCTIQLDYTLNNGLWTHNHTSSSSADDTYLRVRAVSDDSKLHWNSNVGSAPAAPTSSDPAISDLAYSTATFSMQNPSGSGDATLLRVILTMGSTPAVTVQTDVLPIAMIKM